MSPYRFLPLLLVTVAVGAVASAPAEAEPATAACTAPAPAEGVRFSGPVLQVLDSQRLCIATGPTPDQWVAVQPEGLVRAANRPPAAQRSLLMTAAFSKTLDCIAGPSHDGVVDAVCTVGGAALSETVEAAQDLPAWRLWR